jgi:hypothetical protein
VYPASPEVYYSVTVTDTANYTFDSCLSAFDTYLQLYTDSNGSPGSLIEQCDDCGPCHTQAVMTVLLVPGSYLLVVQGFEHFAGAFSITTECDILYSRISAVGAATDVATFPNESYDFVGVVVNFTNAQYNRAAFIITCAAVDRPSAGSFVSVYGSYVYNVTTGARSQVRHFTMPARSTGVVRLWIKLKSKPNQNRLLSTGAYVLRAHLTPSPAAAGMVWNNRFAYSGDMPFNLISQSAVVTELQPSVMVSRSAGGALRGQITASIGGSYSLVAIIRSTTDKGWVRSFSHTSAPNGVAANFTVTLARWMPTDSYTLEIVVLPEGGAWTDQLLTTNAVVFTATNFNEAGAIGGDVATASDSQPNHTDDSSGESSGHGLVLALAVAATGCVLVLALMWHSSSRHSAAAAISETITAESDANTVPLNSVAETWFGESVKTEGGVVEAI